MEISKQTNENVISLVKSLSRVKKQIGEMFLSGVKEIDVAKKFRQAFVTMVLDKIKLIDKDYFDGKNYLKVVVSNTKSDYSEGEGKQDMRCKALLAIQRAAKKYDIRTGKILTLSCYECFAEIMINKYFSKFKFQSYECEAAHFILLLNNIKVKNLSFMLEPIFNKIIKGILEAKKDTYSHLLLDFCQTLPTHAQDIETALRNDIVVIGGIVWITVSNRAGKGYKGYNTKKELIELIDRVGGGRYVYDKSIFPLNYNDDGGMTSIILQRIK